MMKINKIWLFLLISIAAHVTAISLIQDESDILVKLDSTVNVRLVTPVNTTKLASVVQSTSKETQKNITNQREPPVNLDYSKNSQVTNEIFHASQIKITEAPGPLTDSTSSAEIINGVRTPEDEAKNKTIALQYIQDKFAKHFNYPGIAVIKGWQGKVLLGFQLKKNGNIENIYIVQSSGHALLDRAASKSLEKIQSIPQSNAWFKQASTNLQLPVIYKLQEG